MTDLTPNHPAVEAAARAALRAGWTCDTHEPLPWGECPDCTESHLRTAPRALTAVLPHLTADDLRHTPAGRELKAEGWDEGAGATNRAWGHAYDGHPADPDFPYHECQTCNTANPYQEET